MSARPLLLALAAAVACAADDPVQVNNTRVTSDSGPDAALQQELDRTKRELSSTRSELIQAHDELEQLRDHLAEIEGGAAPANGRTSVSTQAAADLQKACDALSAAAKAEVARLKDLRDEAGQSAADKLDQAAKALSAAAASLRGQTPTTTKGE